MARVDNALLIMPTIDHSASDTLRASLDFGPEVRRRVRAHLEAEGADLPSTHLSHKKQPRRAKSAARSRTPTPTQGSKLQHGDGGRVSTPVKSVSDWVRVTSSKYSSNLGPILVPAQSKADDPQPPQHELTEIPGKTRINTICLIALVCLQVRCFGQ